MRDIHHRRDCGCIDQRPRTMSDIYGQVTHPLQVRVDLQSRNDETKIDRHRLVKRQQVDCEPVDLSFDRVDPALVFQDFVGRASVLVSHRTYAALDSCFYKRTHLDQLFLQMVPDLRRATSRN